MREKLGQSLESLSPEQRAERYRQFAEDALRRAKDAANPDQRSEYVNMAAGWHTMALEAEKSASIALLAARGRERKAKGKEKH